VSAGVLALAAVTVLALGGSAYRQGRALDPSERFFREAGRPPSAGEGAMAACMEYALFSSEPNDVIFVGDSACGNAIDPIKLRQLTGLQAYNLSLPGVGARSCPITVKGYLSRHPKPKAVVLCLSPVGLEVDSGPWEDALLRLNTYYGLEIDGVVPLSESVAYLVRAGMRSLLGHPDYRSMQLEGCREPETYFTQRPKIFAARGFHGVATNISVPNVPAPNGVLIREDWDRGVHEMAEACDAAGVRMLILFAPIDASYKDSRDFERLDRWGRELEQTHPTLTVERPIILAYEPRLMCDAIHLNVAGVEKFMPVVAKEMQEVLGH
jgi:hypothetical protein